MQDHDRVGARRTLALGAAGVRLPVAAAVAAEDEDVLTRQQVGPAGERLLGGVVELALLDLGRDREGDEAEQEPADDAISTQRSQRRRPPPPRDAPAQAAAAPGTALAPQRGQVGLAQAVAQARAASGRPCSRVCPSALPEPRFRRRGACLPLLAVLAVDGVLGLLGTLGLLVRSARAARAAVSSPCGDIGYQYLPHARRRRPPPTLSSREAIGVDLGGTKLLIGVVDSEQNDPPREPRVVDRARARTSWSRSHRARAERGDREARPDVLAAGLGIPCTIDRERGVAINAVNLEITDVPIRDLMRERVGLPVFIDNDANCAALAEHRFGAGEGRRAILVMLTIGTGIGGGLIIERRALPRLDRRRRRAGPHGDRRERPPLPGHLPQPRVPRDARLGHRARPRGNRRRRPRAGLGARHGAGEGRGS